MHLHDCDQRNANCYKHAESEICLNTGVKEVLPLISKSRELRRTELLPSVSEAIVQMALTKKGKLALFLTEHVFIDMYIYIYIFFCVFATTVCFGSLLNHHVEGVPPRDHLDQTMTLNNYNYGRMSSPLSTTHRPHFGLLQVHHPKHAGHSSKQSQIVGCPWTTRSTLGAASGNINPIGPLHMYLQDDSFRESDHLIPFESICAFFPGRKLEDKRQHAVDDHDCLYC